MAKYKQPAINLAKQYFALSANSQGNGILTHNKLSWFFQLQPTPLSRQYSLALEYLKNKTPKIFVVKPDLNILANGRDIPHMYDQKKGELCLYLPGAGEWNNRLLLINTAIPWASLWLYFFEEWLFSNEWKGGGKHPDISRIKRN